MGYTKSVDNKNDRYWEIQWGISETDNKIRELTKCQNELLEEQNQILGKDLSNQKFKHIALFLYRIFT